MMRENAMRLFNCHVAGAVMQALWDACFGG